MVVVESLDLAHSVIARVNSDSRSSGVWIATFILAGLFFPSLLGFIGPAGLSKSDAACFFPAALLVAVVYAYSRRRSLEHLRASIFQPVPRRARLVALFFLFLATVLSALAVRVSPWAGLVVLLLVAALPWRQWAVPPGAP